MSNDTQVDPRYLRDARGSLAGVAIKRDGQYLKLPNGNIAVWNYFEEAARYAATLAGKVEVVSVYV